eukprot:4157697-Pyramimonas_sp.AAC.1
MMKITRKVRDSRGVVASLTRFLNVYHDPVITLLQQTLYALHTCSDSDMAHTLVSSITYAGYAVVLIPPTATSPTTPTTPGDYSIERVVNENMPNVLTNDTTASAYIENIHATLSDADTFLSDMAALISALIAPWRSPLSPSLRSRGIPRP